jgi:hypothetical protein
MIREVGDKGVKLSCITQMPLFCHLPASTQVVYAESAGLAESESADVSKLK